MKYYRFYLKANRKLLLCMLGIILSIDLLIFAADLENMGVDGYWKPLLISLGFTVLTMLILIGLIVFKVRKDMDFLKLYDRLGPCQETIELYRRKHPKMRVIDHLVICTYYKAMGDLDEAERIISFVSSCVMPDIRTRAYYSEILLGLRIHQRRFQEAAVIFNNYNSMMSVYCRSNPGAIAVEHYSHAALMYAMSGNINAALDAISLMDKSIRRERQLAFSRNTALMGVYLIGGDYRKADELKTLMLRDVKDFDGFLFESNRGIVLKDIESIETLFDPRAKAH